MSQASVFEWQAAQCDGRSPLYAELCRRFATDPEVGAIVGDDPDWGMPLRLLGGMHWLVLDGDATWDDPPATHAEFLREFVRTRVVQTNEVRRSWMLLPCFLKMGAEELDLIEIGPSAGLNLVWDRYRYRYEAGTWGSADALLELSGEERRPVPAQLLAREIQVASRVGIDSSPIDVTTDEGARLLECFVWADQTERLERLRHAIEALRQDPPALVQGDAVKELPRLLAGDSDRLTVVMQTAVFGYIDEDGMNAIFHTLDEAAARRPLAYVGTHQPAPDEHSYWGLAIRVWPGEREIVAHGDFHGAWLDWLP